MGKEGVKDAQYQVPLAHNLWRLKSQSEWTAFRKGEKTTKKSRRWDSRVKKT